jgi:sarcosine oxidase subunit beta
MDLPSAAPCVVVGGGIAGTALAAHLADLGMRGVVLLEREAGLGEGATAKSAGGIRQQFGDAELVRAARETVRMLGTFARDTGTDPEFRRHGYLLLAAERDRAERLRADAEAQRALGVEVEHLDAAGVKRRFPCIEVGDVVAGNFCGTDGYLAPHGLVEGYRAVARRGGAAMHVSREVIALEVAGGRAAGVRVGGTRIASPLVAVAAGADAGPLLLGAGVRLPLRPTLRRLFFTRPLPALPADLPLVLDLDRPFYFRPESGGVLLSLAEVEEGGRAEPPAAVDGALPERLVERAVNRCPILGEARLLRSWQGHRTLTPDDRPVLGEAPGVKGLWLAVGFGGHGITHAPSLCRALAETVVRGRPETLDLAPYRPDRPALASA